MKLNIIVLLLSVLSTQAQDFMSKFDIFNEMKKITTMEEKLNALNDEVKELRSKNEGIMYNALINKFEKTCSLICNVLSSIQH